MPGYKGHLSGGLVVGCIAVGGAVISGRLACTPLYLAGLMGFCLLGALFPDVDTDSKGQNLFYGMLIVVEGTLIYLHQYRSGGLGWASVPCCRRWGTQGMDSYLVGHAAGGASHSIHSRNFFQRRQHGDFPSFLYCFHHWILFPPAYGP